MAADEAFYVAAERRIEYWTLALGAVATLVAAPLWGRRVAAGVGVGAGLSWLNYRWLKQGVSSMAVLSTAQSTEEKVRVPKRIYVKFLGRYALLLLIAYVILSRFGWPVLAVLAGLLAAAGGVLFELICQLIRGMQRE
jgi:small-conductance mechanosensitive channel